MSKEYADLMVGEIGEMMEKLYDALNEEHCVNAKGIAAALALAGSVIVKIGNGSGKVSKENMHTVGNILNELDKNPHALGGLLIQLSKMTLDAHYAAIAGNA